ncbi:hypothetical protein J6590_048959 [Homalodisca vitripennis]|nr:hypothetical protein J6590_048959 [Homalodisca vitripennis]
MILTNPGNAIKYIILDSNQIQEYNLNISTYVATAYYELKNLLAPPCNLQTWILHGVLDALVWTVDTTSMTWILHGVLDTLVWTVDTTSMNYGPAVTILRPLGRRPHNLPLSLTRKAHSRVHVYLLPYCIDALTKHTAFENANEFFYKYYPSNGMWELTLNMNHGADASGNITPDLSLPSTSTPPAVTSSRTPVRSTHDLIGQECGTETSPRTPNQNVRRQRCALAQVGGATDEVSKCEYTATHDYPFSRGHYVL